MPRPIASVDELDALPHFSIVTRNSVPYTKTLKGWQLAGAWHVYSAESLLLNGNATLIHEPTA